MIDPGISVSSNYTQSWKQLPRMVLVVNSTEGRSVDQAHDRNIERSRTSDGEASADADPA